MIWKFGKEGYTVQYMRHIDMIQIPSSPTKRHFSPLSSFVHVVRYEYAKPAYFMLDVLMDLKVNVVNTTVNCSLFHNLTELGFNHTRVNYTLTMEVCYTQIFLRVVQRYKSDSACGLTPYLWDFKRKHRQIFSKDLFRGMILHKLAYFYTNDSKSSKSEIVFHVLFRI